jgi:uncharacterized protein (TIGR02145 family)
LVIPDQKKFNFIRFIKILDIIEVSILFSPVHGLKGFPDKKSLGIIFLIFFLATSGELFPQSITVSPDTIICLGGSVTLNAVVVGGGYGTSSYTFLAIPYNPMPFSGGVALDTSFDHPNHCTASGHDDCWGGPFDIGFSFCFLNVDYTQFWIGSNGWISFSQPTNQWDNYTPDTLPNSSNNTPKNCIMAPWQDWFPGAGGVGNNIFYYTSGTEPDRKCVIYWLNCPMYGCTSTLGTFQIVINEQNSIIENNIQEKDSCSWQQNRGTQGVQNLTGTEAFIHPGRNNKSWEAYNESTRFVPGGITWYIGGYPGGTPVGYGPTITVRPNNTTIYTGVAEVCGGAFSAANDTVIVMDPRFDYFASSFCLNQSNPIPLLDMNAGIFSSMPDGLVFVNDTTGEIDLAASIPGTYLITHTITSPCTVSFDKSVILYAPPDMPNPVNPVMTRCGSGNVTLSVTVDLHQGVKWYNSLSGGIQYPFTGLTVTTAITSTTNFYAEAFDSITGCGSSFRSLITAIVQPVPSIINTILNDTICSGFNNYFQLLSDLPGTSFFWTASCTLGSISGFITPNSGNIISDTLTNNLFTSGNVTYVVHAFLNGCDDTVDFITSINPKPNVVFQSPSDTICSGETTNIILSSGVSSAIFTWIATGSGNVSGFSDGSGDTISQTLTNTGASFETVTYQVIPSTNGCQGQPANLVITVKPTPALTTTPLAQFLCSGATSAINLTSSLAGTTFVWTVVSSSPDLSGYSEGTGNAINQTIVNSGFTIDTLIYTITPTANGCTGTASGDTVTVYPTPDLANTPLSESICQGSPTNITLTSNVTGTLFTWTCTPSSGFVTGYSDNSTPANFLNQILYNSNNAAETVTYHITPHANGCIGITIDFVVFVNPIPTITLNPMNKTICSGSTTNISLTSTTIGTNYSWIGSLATGNITGFTSDSGSLINDSLTDILTTQGSVNYILSASVGGCTARDTIYIVNVNPIPHLTTSPLSKNICSNSSSNIILTADITGTTFTWTISASSGNVSGFSDGSGTVINQVLINSGFNIETVTYHITPHANGCDGSISDYIVTVNPLPDLTNLPLSEQQCNNTVTNITLTSDVANTQFTWTTTPSSGNVSGYSDNAIPTTLLNQTLVNSGYNIETVTYHIIPDANNCDGNLYNYVVTVYPTPDLTNTPLSKQQCSNIAIGLTLTSHVTGTLFTWICIPSSGNVTGFSDNAVPTVSLNQILINTGFNVETVTYSIIPHANGCDGQVFNYVVTVYPVPNLSNIPLSEQICTNQQTNVTLTSGVTGTLFTWICTPSSGNVIGYSNNSVPTNFLNQTLVNTGFLVETVTYHITPQANGCFGPVTNYVVVLVPKPDLSNSPLSKQICDNTSTNVTLTSDVAGTQFTWTATGSSINVSGYSDNTLPTILLNQILVNTGFNIETVIYHITPHSNGCDGDVTDYTVTVYPVPDLSNSPLAKQQCNNLTITLPLTSDVANTLFTWTCTPSSGNITGFSNNATPSSLLNQTLINNGYSTETVIYHFSPHANGCDGLITDYIVTVYPTVDVYYAPSSQTICSGQTTNLQVLSHVTGATFVYTAIPSSPNLSGYSGGTTNLIAQTLTNSGITIETVTYHTIPAANGCTGNPSDVVVTVNPTPVVTTILIDQIICSSNTIAIALTSNVSGSTFAWTAFSSSPDLSGYSGGNGNTINQTITNSGFTIDTVTYSITPTANGCSGPVANFVVTVNPQPDLSNNPLNSQICSGTPTNINLTSNVTGTIFTWTCTSSSGNVTGFSPGSGVIINQVLTNLGINNETVTYHITPQANGCTGLTKDFVVTVTLVPDVYFQPGSQTLCSGQTTNIQNLSHVTGTTFSWTASASSPNLSGFSAGTGNVIAQTLYNSGLTIQTVTYTVSPQVFGCPAGPSQNVIVTVNPLPSIINSITSFQQCSSVITSILLQADLGGITFSWTALGSSGSVTGYSGGSGSIIAQILTNSGLNTDTVTYVVTPVVNTCAGNPVAFTVAVFPVPDVYITPDSESFCPGGTTFLSLASHVAGVTFTWTAASSSGNVSGFGPGSGNLIQQTLNSTDYLTETVNYAVTPIANACNGNVGHAIVSIFPLPPVNLTICWDTIVTTDAQPIKLKGGVPLGGTYSGVGINTSIFYPGVAGMGVFPITYGYTNTWGCTKNSSKNITVISSVIFSCGNDLTDVRDNKIYPTVQIGTQCWMAANLNFGNVIASFQMQRDNCVSEKYCYGDNFANCSSTGGLYQWDEMMKFDNTSGAQGFCPPSWHVPTEGEWSILFTFYSGYGFAGSPLKFSGYSGFNAFLSGIRHENVIWDFDNFVVMYWSSTSQGADKAWAHGMNSINPSVSYYPGLKDNAFYVRCIKD